jgi:L-threonylcarbamoyladenylate synthase
MEPKSGSDTLNTKIIKIEDASNFDVALLAEAVHWLKQNKAIAFPTETVYGLGANALNQQAGT